MVNITMQVTDELAQRLKSIHTWLPTVLELSLIGFKTSAVQTASEIIAFLSNGPSPTEVIAYTVSERAQQRLNRLLALNEAGLLSAEEQAELDEIEQIEHIMILLKAKMHKQGANLTALSSSHSHLRAG
ncbi:MAG: hypothetical protein JW953_01610 [Anaerolineae bacterium]|nr:hypothetical protein [Anaerolineae bacterium]